jgi:hypothetical protein
MAAIQQPLREESPFSCNSTGNKNPHFEVSRISIDFELAYPYKIAENNYS